MDVAPEDSARLLSGGGDVTLDLWGHPCPGFVWRLTEQDQGIIGTLRSMVRSSSTSVKVPCGSLSLAKAGQGRAELCYAMLVKVCLELDDMQLNLDVLHQTWFCQTLLDWQTR
jgi:hypothetical protein